MANSFNISGAPKFTNVTTAAALHSAVAAAKPGEVITLTEVVASFTLALSQAKAAPGICVVLPAAQPAKAVLTAKNLNTEVVGGSFTNPTEAGNGNYTIDCGNSSHFAFRGGTLGLGDIVISAVLASDFVFADALLEWPKNDFIQINASNRFRLDRLYGRNLIKGQKMRWFTDGRQPIDNIGAPSPQNVTNGFWVDTSHNDAAQIRSNASPDNSPVGGPSTALPSTDFVIDQMDIHVLGAGIVSFDYDPYSDLPDATIVERAIVSNSSIFSTDAGAISIAGQDVTLINNVVGPHPTDPGGAAVSMGLFRRPGSGGGRIQGGNNSAVGGAFFSTSSGGPDLAAPLNGDPGVLAPAPPGFGVRRLPWAPAVTRPTYAPHTLPPEIIGAPGVFWLNYTTAPPTTGTWLTAGQGTTKGFEGSTGEWRWMRNGVAIVGATARIYQVQAADLGQAITVETRRTNANGTGAWKASSVVSPV